MNTSFDILEPYLPGRQDNDVLPAISITKHLKLNTAALKMAGNCPRFTIAFERSTQSFFICFLDKFSTIRGYSIKSNVEYKRIESFNGIAKNKYYRIDKNDPKVVNGLVWYYLSPIDPK